MVLGILFSIFAVFVLREDLVAGLVISGILTSTSEVFKLRAAFVARPVISPLFNLCEFCIQGSNNDLTSKARYLLFNSVTFVM